ncbi:hypothetical protein B0H19DRAFT_1244618 [Mycena capillaripes]|nr:hypothetical protein B0H19DRAFT_1244618 [Mycena capillaripes]
MIPRTSENDLFLSSTSASPVMSSESETPKITLHWLEKSRSQRILWLLEELKVPYDIKTYKRDSKTGIAAPELKVIHLSANPPSSPLGLCYCRVGLGCRVPNLALWSLFDPTKWKPGCEERSAARRRIHALPLLHALLRGSLMSLLVVLMLSNNIKTAPVPFFIRPLPRRSQGKSINHTSIPILSPISTFSRSNCHPSQWRTVSLRRKITGADMMMSFPVIVVTSELGDRGMNKETYPKLFAYASC